MSRWTLKGSRDGIRRPFTLGDIREPHELRLVSRETLLLRMNDIPNRLDEPRARRRAWPVYCGRLPQLQRRALLREQGWEDTWSLKWSAA